MEAEWGLELLELHRQESEFQLSRPGYATVGKLLIIL